MNIDNKKEKNNDELIILLNIVKIAIFINNILISDENRQSVRKIK